MGHDGRITGGGTCGELIRRFDWRATSLGPLAGWPESLVTLVRLMLASRQPMFIVWGRDRITLYNDGYAEILQAKHPAIGQPFAAIWPEIWDDLAGIVERAYAGEAVQMDDIPLVMTRRGYPEETHFAFSYTPVRDDRGEVHGFFCACTETTGHVLEHRRSLLRAELTDRLRDLDDEEEIRALAARLLSRHLGGARVGCAEADAEGGMFSLRIGWTRDAEEITGSYRIEDFGPGIAGALRAGRSIRCPDVTRDPATADFAAAFAAQSVRSFAATPLVRSGRLAAVCLAVAPAPRHWARGDVALIHEVGERVWNAVERLRALTRQQDSEDQLRLALDAAKAGTFQYWPDPGQPPLVSASLKRLFGFAAGQTPSIADFVARIHPEDRAEVRARMQRSLERGEGHYLEYRVQRPDGSLVHVASRAEPVPVPNGGTACLRGALLDITDRKAAEAEQTRLAAAADRARALLQAVAETTQDLIYVKDLDRRLLFLNPATARALGQPAERLLDTLEAQWYPVAEEADAVGENDRKVIESGTSQRFEETVTGPDGARVYLSTKAPLRDAEGRITGVVGVTKDVTSLRAVERETRRERELLRAIIDSIPVMIAVYDPSVNMMLLNREFERLTGWSTESAAGISLMEEVYPDPAYRAEVWRFMQSCTGWMDIRMRTREGDTLETSWANVRLADDRLVGIGLDITDRKQAERHRKLLVDELNHRVKNTLAVVQAIAAQSFRPVPGAAEAQRAFSGRLAALAAAHDLLTATNWEAAELGALARASIGAACGSPEAIALAGPRVVLPPKQALTLAMALHELCTNAAKYGALSVPQGRIALTWQTGRGAAARTLTLTWRESGGPEVTAPARRGFGTLMIEQALAQDFDGEVQLAFDPGGLACRMTGTVRRTAPAAP